MMKERTAPAIIGFVAGLVAFLVILGLTFFLAFVVESGFDSGDFVLLGVIVSFVLGIIIGVGVNSEVDKYYKRLEKNELKLGGYVESKNPRDGSEKE